MLDAEDYRDWLTTQPIIDKTRVNQVSRVRRLEKIFGDLHDAYAHDKMATVLDALEYSPADAAAAKPLPSKLKWSGDIVSVMQTLRHAANTYYRYAEERFGGAAPSPARRTKFAPLRSPLAAPTRQWPPTGFWTFQANAGVWNIDDWAREAGTDLLYRVSKDDRDLVQIGDLGLLRRVSGNKSKAAIVAIVEVIEPAQVRADEDPRFYVDPAAAQIPDYRARLAVRHLPDAPLLIADLPDDQLLDRVRHGLQRTTTPIPQSAFEWIAGALGLSVQELEDQRAAQSMAGIRALEAAMPSMTPTRRQAVSVRIERGPIGDAVKKARQHRCQLCEALGLDGIAFVKASGEPYAEAHHVVPVAGLLPGSLGASNIMVLCPNHHRQAHYGQFEVLLDTEASWIVALDGASLTIPRTVIS